jgi:hypothetical protein
MTMRALTVAVAAPAGWLTSENQARRPSLACFRRVSHLAIGHFVELKSEVEGEIHVS